MPTRSRLEVRLAQHCRGGKGNDTIGLAAVDGGEVGGQLGADTMVVGGVLKNALVGMTNVSDPENGADLADSLTVGGSSRTARSTPVLALTS